MLSSYKSMLTHSAAQGVTLGQGMRPPKTSIRSATTQAATAGGNVPAGQHPGTDNTQHQAVFEAATKALPDRQGEKHPDDAGKHLSPSTAHRLEGAIAETLAPGQGVHDTDSLEQAASAPGKAPDPVRTQAPTTEQTNALDALFQTAIELTASDQIPEAQRHRLETGIFDVANRRLTGEIRQAGPQAQMTAAAVDRAQQVAGDMLTAGLRSTDIPPEECEEIVEYQSNFARQRALNAPESHGELKFMMDRRLEAKHGAQSAQAMRNQYEVIACSTSFETDLRPAGTGLREVQTVQAGEMRTILRPMNQPESPGTCFGRTSHFIHHVAEGLRAGEDVRSLVVSGSTDATTIVPGTLKQKIYHHAHDAQRTALSDSEQDRRVSLALIEQDRTLGNTDNAAATRQIEAVEQRHLEQQTTIFRSLFAPLGLDLQSCMIDTETDQARPDAISGAVATGGLNAVIGNIHAVAHIKHDDTHYIFDTLCGVYGTDDDDMAKELARMSLETGQSSAIGSYHFGPTPEAT